MALHYADEMANALLEHAMAAAAELICQQSQYFDMARVVRITDAAVRKINTAMIDLHRLHDE